MRKLLLLTVCLLAVWQLSIGQERFRIISYNVENLFDTKHDSLMQDTEFTPEGERHWTYTRYQTKLRQIARVVANIGEWETPAIIGLCEVENEQCLLDLCKWGPLKNYGYEYIHQDGEDVRGIDCALLYDKKQFQPVAKQFINIQTEGRPTRDIVYAKGIAHRKDTLHVLLCHFPSQRGGTSATAKRREVAWQTLQRVVDSIAQPTAKIVVMGDFNTAAEEHLQSMHNMMLEFETQSKGSYKYKGIWSCLDQFYISPALLQKAEAYIYDAEWLQEEDPAYLGTRPKRTYQGYRYQTDGYSDHLPIVLNINL